MNDMKLEEAEAILRAVIIFCEKSIESANEWKIETNDLKARIERYFDDFREPRL